MVLVTSLYELSRPSSPSGLLHGIHYVVCFYQCVIITSIHCIAN